MHPGLDVGQIKQVDFNIFCIFIFVGSLASHKRAAARSIISNVTSNVTPHAVFKFEQVGFRVRNGIICLQLLVAENTPEPEHESVVVERGARATNFKFKAVFTCEVHV